MSTAHRIPITHVGSLPRPAELITLITAQDRGDAVDGSRLAALVRGAVRDVVAKQAACGVDIVSDGEMSKMSYTNYMKHRLSGFDGVAGPLMAPADLVANPEYVQYLRSQDVQNPLNPPACTGPIAVKDRAFLEADLANFADALAEAGSPRAFMSAASPGVISIFMPNQYYASEDAYVEALAEALADEYESIAAAGFDVQLDCPDLAMGRHMAYKALSLEEFRRRAARNVEALNHATRNIAPERLRMHLCWGNYPGPHTCDVPVGDVLDIVMKARPRTVLFEASNPRHGHEHATFAEKRHLIPDDKVLAPGVVDTNTNVIEHPDLVMQRLLAFANIVGRERVIAGTDCGFSTVASRPRVFPTLVWQKLQAMREGADRAARLLWR